MALPRTGFCLSIEQGIGRARRTLPVPHATVCGAEYVRKRIYSSPGAYFWSRSRPDSILQDVPSRLGTCLGEERIVFGGGGCRGGGTTKSSGLLQHGVQHREKGTQSIICSAHMFRATPLWFMTPDVTLYAIEDNVIETYMQLHMVGRRQKKISV